MSLEQGGVQGPRNVIQLYEDSVDIGVELRYKNPRENIALQIIDNSMFRVEEDIRCKSRVLINIMDNTYKSIECFSEFLITKDLIEHIIKHFMP